MLALRPKIPNSTLLDESDWSCILELKCNTILFRLSCGEGTYQAQTEVLCLQEVVMVFED